MELRGGRRFLAGVIGAALVWFATAGRAQEPAVEPAAEAEVETAPVRVDGEVLFALRGGGSYTAERRATAVAQRIVAVAADPAIMPDQIRVIEADGESRIVAADRPLLRLLDEDAAVAGLRRATLAEICAGEIREAIEAWRARRTREALVAGATYAGAALLIAIVGGFVIVRLFRAIDRRLGARVEEQKREAAAAGRKFVLLPRHRVARVIRVLVLWSGRLALALLLFSAIRRSLLQFPWTRAAGVQLGQWVLAPLAEIGRGFVEKLPDLIFLVVLVLLVRMLLGILRRFFDALGSGEYEIDNFDPDWAAPTYKLIRIVVVAFAVVIAYPYVPGSSTEAFKGVSIFFGLLVSIGASSMIGNLIAGFTMTYRKAFREGDVIKVGDVFGRVTQSRLVVTHLRTPKNEEVVVPNSMILSNEVTNYSTLSQKEGLLLHTQVGIGYETPWRHVEAMLLEAARRTPGLLPRPEPFVWIRGLGDFAITYELNAPCDDPRRMPALYTELHRRILDVFNENGVQIMTPAYEGDPEIPKTVAPGSWEVALAAAAPSSPGAVLPLPQSLRAGEAPLPYERPNGG